MYHRWRVVLRINDQMIVSFSVCYSRDIYQFGVNHHSIGHDVRYIDDDAGDIVVSFLSEARTSPRLSKGSFHPDSPATFFLD